MTFLQLRMTMRKNICMYDIQTFNHMNITLLMSYQNTFYTSQLNHLSEFGHAFDRDTIVYPSETLFVRKRFDTKKETQNAINRFHIINHYTYKVVYSTQSRLIVQFVHNDCAWRCRAILRTKNQH